MTNRQPESRAGPFGYASPFFDVSVRSDSASTLVVKVEGELDLVTGPILHQHLKPYQGLPKSDRRPQRVVYHLSDLRFMDATGLDALLTAIDGHGPHTIIVQRPSYQVRRILELVGLGSMIEDENQKARP